MMRAARLAPAEVTRAGYLEAARSLMQQLKLMEEGGSTGSSAEQLQ